VTDGLIMESFRYFGTAAGALGCALEAFAEARRDTDIKEARRAIAAMRRASHTNRDARRILLSIAPLDGRFESELFDQLSEQRQKIFELQEAVIAFLKSFERQSLATRIGSALAHASTGLSYKQIAEHITAQDKEIAEAIADWKLALGAAATFVITPNAVQPEQVRRALQDKGAGRSFSCRRTLLGTRWLKAA
jgi:hypothetical protein